MKTPNMQYNRAAGKIWNHLRATCPDALCKNRQNSIAALRNLLAEIIENPGDGSSYTTVHDNGLYTILCQSLNLKSLPPEQQQKVHDLWLWLLGLRG